MNRFFLPHAARASALWLLACNGTETDNPVADGSQGPFDSPWQFEPAASPPGCVPDDSDAPPRVLPLWGLAGGYLVGLDSGLVVLDVSDPSAPSLVARHALHGQPRQLLVEGTAVTLVLDELPMFAAAPVPAADSLEAVTRLIRFDISEPSAPVRVADVAIEDEFWRLVPRAGGYWVMSARVVPPEPSCELPDPFGCSYVQREALVLERYAFDAGAFTRVEQTELPMTHRAVSTEHGFAAATRTAQGGVLSLARFDADGHLEQLQQLPLEEPVLPQSPIYLGPERTAFFTSGLRVAPPFGGPTAGIPELGGAAFARFPERGVFVSEGYWAAPATFVDWTDLDQLRTTLLSNVTHVIPIPGATGGATTRALGWQQTETGTTFSLLGLDTASPSVLTTVTTELTPQSPDAVWIDGAQAFVHGDLDGATSVIGRVSFDADVLSVQAPLFDVYAREVVSAGDWTYAAGLGSVQSRALGGGSAWLELQAEVIDVAVAGSSEAALLRSLDGSVRLEVRSGEEAQSLEVSRAAERVLAAGDRWIVLSARSAFECRQLQTDCDGYQPHVAVAGGAPLAILGELPLPAVAAALGPLGQLEVRWAASAESGPAPLDLGAGRWLFTRELSATCLTESDCETLGVDYVPISEANVAVGQQEPCPPGASTCDSQPLPEPTVYGSTTRRAYFVLDAEAAAFSEAVEIGTDGDMFWSTALWSGPRRSGDTLLDLRLEALERVGGTPRRVRFWLERLTPSSEGLLREPSVAIPGYPIGLLAPDTLLSAQPEAGETGRARLHRVQLDARGAEIESTLVLDARHGDVQLVGDHAVYVKLPTTACELETALEAIAVGGASLSAPSEPTARLSLPGGDWRVLSVVADQLVLSEQSRAFARIRVGEDGALSLEAFATAPWYVQGALWKDGVLLGVSRDGVVRLPL